MNETYKDHSDTTEDKIEVVEDFQAFLTERGVGNEQDITREDTAAYVVKIRERNGDLYKKLVHLNEYAAFIRNEDLMSEAMLLRDAWNVMNRASELTKKIQGSEVWGKIFGDVEMPQIGWTLDEMTDFSREFDKRALMAMPRNQYEHICVKNAHSWEPEWDSDWREEFLKYKSVDKFIEVNNEYLIRELERCRNEGSLFFTQEVDECVIEYVKANPQFYRIGNKIHVKRMPFLTKRYLNETDKRMKRHYACHCAWIRNSILQPEGAVSKSFCYCSLGHDKRRFDVAFDQEVSGRVIETVMDDDSLLCIFEIDIPDDIMREYT